MRRPLPRLGTAWSLALREMRGGLSGFYIFLACIALGTGAIAAVNSVSRAITGAIATQGQDILAADIRFELDNREANPEELAFLQELGDLSVSTGLRSMARVPDGSEQGLVEVKAVDGAYPLYGAFEAEPNRPLGELLRRDGAMFGAVAAPLLLDRLGLAPGDELLLGNVRLRLSGTVVSEPDAISDGFGFAPRLLVSREALMESGLIQTGSLVEHAYKIAWAIPASAAPFPPAPQRSFPMPDGRSERPIGLRRR
ncbi:ABC transporter permease [Pseudorhizobium endolithicum]|uniref:ABC transporter permease n=1 Tax=Pseudorhizobium endolithicum TaxID=1191678 RepID=A0ABN7JU07_9HYPH|nr:ABC transporter permease [Pseudorhizobium endolithicum]